MSWRRQRPERWNTRSRARAPQVLSVHGVPGGYDQAIMLGRPFTKNGFATICPSRPGYLRTPLSTGRTIEEQADAMAALLDYLELEKVGVVCCSAGGLRDTPLPSGIPNVPGPWWPSTPSAVNT
ncbi:MAG: hypothetical protein SWK76_14260 [Actinomycetota bacterium]|nr:hypothetical protein [Actinomycetota bacterium]